MSYLYVFGMKDSSAPSWWPENFICAKLWKKKLICVNTERKLSSINLEFK